jgi:hypothetical protein
MPKGLASVAHARPMSPYLVAMVVCGGVMVLFLGGGGHSVGVSGVLQGKRSLAPSINPSEAMDGWMDGWAHPMMPKVAPRNSRTLYFSHCAAACPSPIHIPIHMYMY